MRFIRRLLPLLEAAGPSRVISVYGGGMEFPIDMNDLDLKHNFSLLNSYKQSITMTSLSMDYLAARHPGTSFIHVYPGLVLGTNIYTNSFPAPVAAFYNYGMWPLMKPFSVNLRESGERHLFHLSSARYPAKKGLANQGVSVASAGVEVARGMTGEIGGGAYLLNWKGETQPTKKFMQEYREKGVGELVWRHTEEMWDQGLRR